MKNTFKIDNNGRVIRTEKISNPAENVSKIKPTQYTHDQTGVDKTDYQILTNTTDSAVNKIDMLKGLGKNMQLEATYKTYEPLVKKSSATPYFIVSQGYYLAFDSGRVLFKKKNSTGEVDGGLPTILRKPLDGASGSGCGVVKTSYVSPNPANKNMYQKPQGIDLTSTDFDNIIKGKPSVEALLDVYDQYSNDSIDIEISRAVPIW
ncbi:MAG: hypothetical protein WCH62_08115 [Candidatus Omnitrophota bacterium]